MNVVILKGNLCQEVTLVKTQSGISVLRNCLAVKREFSKEDVSDFINIQAWRGTAEFIAKHFRKGLPILVKGEIQTSKYQDKDGNSRTSTDVIVQSVEFCSSKRDMEPIERNDGSGSNTKSDDYTAVDKMIETDEDLPF